MHLSKIRERINTLLKQYKHNAVPYYENYKCSPYKCDIEGNGVYSGNYLVMGLFVVFSEGKEKLSFFWEQTGYLRELGVCNCDVFDNIVCIAVMTESGYIWLLDVLVWDSKMLKNEMDENFRLQCLSRLATNTTMPVNYSLHMCINVKKIDENMYPSVVNIYKQMTVFYR